MLPVANRGCPPAKPQASFTGDGGPNCTAAKLPNWLRSLVDDEKYVGVMNLPAIGWCGLQSFVYTWGLVVGMTPGGYERRYCYENFSDALEGLRTWSGANHPAGPWIKCKGAGIDLLNPALTDAP